MSLENGRLVRWMHDRLAGWCGCGDDERSLAPALAEVHDRVRRLHRLDGAYAAVRVSRHIAGLRAVSVPDRAGGVPSPGTV